MANVMEYFLDWKILTVLSVIFVIGIKFYLKWTTKVFSSKKRLFLKTVIVTGANTGIGKETARDFAKRGAKVILACRDMKRANEAREDIMRTTGSEEVIVRKLDLASLESVREFAAEILATETEVHVLVNNAGAGGLGNKLTKDGLLIGMQVNHFGPFLLTNLLVGLMKKSAPSRIIFVSSLLHKYTSFDVNNLNFNEIKFNPLTDLQVYNCSKLANVLTANELARRLAGTGVTVNSLEPGTVQSDIFRRTPSWAVPTVNFILANFCKTTVEGAQTSIYLAVSDEVKDVSGKYFAECQEAAMSAMAANEELAKKLWEKSEQFVNLLPSDIST